MISKQIFKYWDELHIVTIRTQPRNWKLQFRFPVGPRRKTNFRECHYLVFIVQERYLNLNLDKCYIYYFIIKSYRYQVSSVNVPHKCYISIVSFKSLNKPHPRRINLFTNCKIIKIKQRSKIDKEIECEREKTIHLKY